MNPLFPLPQELILLVAEHLAPRDHIALAITCRTAWSIWQKDVQEHHALRKKYMTLITQYPELHVWNALEFCNSNPQKAAYIEDLRILGRSQYYISAKDVKCDEDSGDADEGYATRAQRSEEYDTIIPDYKDSQKWLALVNTCPLLSDPRFGKDLKNLPGYGNLKAHLIDGADEMIVLKLLTLVPNLRSLRLQLDVDDNAITGVLARTLLVQKQLKRQKVGFLELSGHLPLQYLRCLILRLPEGDSSCEHFDKIYLLSRMPRLEYFRLTKCSSSGTEATRFAENPDPPINPKLSRGFKAPAMIKDLVITGVISGTTQLQLLLYDLKMLKRFVYVRVGEHDAIGETSYNIGGVVETLQEQCSENLEYLCLGHLPPYDWQDDPDLLDWYDRQDDPILLDDAPKQFHTLRTLICTFTDIQLAQSRGVELLSKSLVTLYLIHAPGDPPKEFIEKIERLPNLKNIRIARSKVHRPSLRAVFEARGLNWVKNIAAEYMGKEAQGLESATGEVSYNKLDIEQMASIEDPELEEDWEDAALADHDEHASLFSVTDSLGSGISLGSDFSLNDVATGEDEEHDH